MRMVCLGIVFGIAACGGVDEQQGQRAYGLSAHEQSGELSADISAAEPTEGCPEDRSIYLEGKHQYGGPGTGPVWALSAGVRGAGELACELYCMQGSALPR